MAFPPATPVTVTTLPDTATVARPGSHEVAEQKRASPSGSLKLAATSTATELPAPTTR